MLFLLLEPMFWFNHCQNLLWIRNHIVAPLSEEFTFRACMLPLLLQSFSPMTSILITPLFFGVGEIFDFFFLIEILRIVVCFSPSSSHDWTSSDGHGQENGRHNLVLPILLHLNIRHLLGVSFHAHWPFHCALHSARFLQPHGFSWSPWSHLAGRAKTMHFPYSLRAGPCRLDSSTANNDWSNVVSESAILDQQHQKPLEHLNQTWPEILKFWTWR